MTFNVTAVDTENRGYIQIFNEEGTAAGETSTVNWTQTGQNIANSGTVALSKDETLIWTVPSRWSSSRLMWAVRRTRKRTTVVDITGYYIPAG